MKCLGSHGPAAAMCEPVSIARVKLTLNGCLDKLGPVTYTSDFTNGKLNLHVTAINVVNERSKVVLCYAAPVAYADLYLGMGILSENEVRVEFAQRMVPEVK